MPHDPTDNALENRIVATLAESGLIRPRARQRWRDAALPVVAFLVGVASALGVQTLQEPARPAAATYMLALYSTSHYQAETAAGRARAIEYGRWAGAAQKGPAVVTGGEELGSPLSVLGPPASRAAELVGYFLVRAGSKEEAVRLARTAPHLRYGGTVVVYETVG